MRLAVQNALKTMQLNKQKVLVSELKIGMYVCELDRPWLETPFLMQGFLIEADEDIGTLSKHCEFVYIDVARGTVKPGTFSHAVAPAVETKQQSQTVIPLRKAKAQPTVVRSDKQRLMKLLSGRSLRKYRDSVAWNQEIISAKKAVEGLNTAIKDMFVSIKQGSGIQFSKLKQAVSPLVSSIERNPDACIWLARLKNQDSYIYKHSVASSIWAVAMGRELGLPPADLKSLALGALLMDIGKLRVPQELLRKKGVVNEQELRVLRNHVCHSIDALRNTSSSNQDIWDMVAHHHERHNGSGYPRGLRGDSIPLVAKIAGIVDCYDAMTSDRPYARSVSPSSAIKHLYQARDTEFDSVLVEEFIQAVGLYPAGTLVLLSSGEVAIVIAEGRARRLKPKVLLLLDADKTPLDELKIINLLEAQCPNSGKSIDIVQSLEPGSFGIDPETIAFDPSAVPLNTADIG